MITMPLPDEMPQQHDEGQTSVNNRVQEARGYHTRIARLLVKMDNGSIPVEGALARVLHETLRLRQQLGQGESLVHPDERVTLVSQAFEGVLSGDDSGRISTGLLCLDNVLLGGLAPGQVTVVAGATGSGKSIVLQQIAENAARDGKTVLFIAVEMDTVQLSYRSLARITNIEASRIRRARLSPEEIELVRAAIQVLGDLPIHYKDGGDMSTAGIYDAVLKTQEEFGRVDMIVADYMQILQDEQGGGNENLRLTGISRSLASIAREFSVPVLVGSQLSRDCVKKGRRPTPQDLRESGSIENDATSVLLLYSHEAPSEEGEPQQEDLEHVSLIVGKNRNGIQNVDIHCNFDKPHQKFLEWPPKQQGLAAEGLVDPAVLTTTPIEEEDPELDGLEF